MIEFNKGYTSTAEMICEIEIEAFNEDVDDAPQPALLTEVLEREELLDALQNTVKVSEETRTQCLAELAAAKQRGYKEIQ